MVVRLDEVANGWILLNDWRTGDKMDEYWTDGRNDVRTGGRNDGKPDGRTDERTVCMVNG